MTKDEAFNQLIQIAARLARGEDLPSDYVEDYRQKTFTAGKVAFLMCDAHRTHKWMAIQISNAADILTGKKART